MATPGVWRDLYRAVHAAYDAASFCHIEKLWLLGGIIPVTETSIIGAGRIGSGLIIDAHHCLKSVMPACQGFDQDAQTYFDGLLGAVASQLKATLLATGSGAAAGASSSAASAPAAIMTVDDVFNAVDAVLPPALASAARSDVESSTSHMGHDPERRTQRKCLFTTAAARSVFGSICDPIMEEIMRVLEFLCVDLFTIVNEMHDGGPHGLSRVLTAVDVCNALRQDEAWTGLIESALGVDDTWAAWNGNGPPPPHPVPLSCMGVVGGQLELINLEEACAQVGGAADHPPPPIFTNSYVCTANLREVWKCLARWGATRGAIMLVRASPDSNNRWPLFVAAELPGGMLAGLAAVADVQD